MTALPAPRDFVVATASAAMFDHGAHVTSWSPVGRAEALFLSSRASFDSSTAIRGGIPICFPWFGPGRSGDLSPAHGFARRTSWSFTSARETENWLEVTYALGSEDVSSDVFPWDFRAEYRIGIGETLDLELAVHNTGTTAFTYEEALHAYLAVGDISSVRIDGLDGSTYRDTAQSGTAHVQHGEVTFTGEVDRVYRSTAKVSVHDPVLDRRIVVTRHGSADVVVWNPWADKAATMSDLGEDEWRRFVCVEGANVGDAAVSLAPGESHVMGYSLNIR